jgi:hypothetical protein
MERVVRFIGSGRPDVLGGASGHMASRFAHSPRGAKAEAETTRMVAEKAGALAEAQVAATAAVLKGSRSHRVTKKALGAYGKRVRRNRRRLAK